MDFDLTEEQRLIQETAADFARNELEPVAAAHDRGGDDQVFLENLQKLADLGFMGLNIREEYGGTGAGVVAFSLAMTELGRCCASTAVTVSVTNMVAEVIQAMGSEQQRQQHLPSLCDGSHKAGAFALTEPQAGSDPAAMTTTARLDGREWVLNGNKIFITSGSFAGLFLVWAVTDPQAPKGKGISLFVVEADRDGLVVGKKEEKMGQNSSPTNEIIFQDCRVPDDNLLGGVNSGFRTAMAELAGGRIGIGSMALGIGLAAIDHASRYALTRRQFGRPLSDFQGIQWKIADTYTELDAARLLLLRAAYLKERGRSFAKEASMAKLFASEAANKACYEAMQIYGGYGYTRDFPLERYARDVRITTIYEGTSEIQRIIIAREILRNLG